ncbi:hypothetical protein N9917_00440 [Deltaproteobacteria bacterium]|nr:hypothetical protein [Deltaproteobacteria bacterium]
MSDLRSEMIKMASELPQGDPTRRKLLAAVKDKTAVDLAVGLDVPRNLVQKAEQAVEAEVAALRAVEAAFNDWLALRKRQGSALSDIREHLDANYENREWRETVFSSFHHATWAGLDTQEFYKHVKAGLDELQGRYGTFGNVKDILAVLEAMK